MDKLDCLGKKKRFLKNTKSAPVLENRPVKEFVGSTMDMKGVVFYTPANKLTYDLIRKVDSAAVNFAKMSLKVFGRNRKYNLGKEKSRGVPIRF
jgi:hypothetical protein